MRSFRLDPARWRSTGIVVLLLVAIVLVATLALQAQYAYRFHRQVAVSVLQDYARLVASEFIRRASTEIGYHGYYSALTALQRQASGNGEGELPSPEGFAGSLDRKGMSAGSLMKTIFLAEPASETVRTTGVPFTAGDRQWVLDSIAAVAGSREAGGHPFDVAHAAGPGGQRTILFAPVKGDENAGGIYVGFEVDLEATAPWFRHAMDRGPLLPASLGDGELSNDLLFISLTDSRERRLFRSGEDYDPALLTYTPFGDTYSGIFAGMTLLASIDPEAAPRLVIGGLPSSRLPVLMSLLLLTVGLLAAAIHQLRRERGLARMRAEFVSRVSHELRTPLTQIRMFAETLVLNRTRTPEERRRSLEILDQEARRLSHLVENILQFSRADRGEVRLAPRPVDMAGLLADTAEKFQPVARAREVRIRKDLAEGVVCLVDDDAMRQVVINLLDNAVKYGPKGQEIRLGLEPGEGRARIWIDDQGPGVAEKDRARIWSRWQRLERHEKAAIAGTGIGLTVVRDLVSLQGGEARIETGDRGGARFVVELPLAPAGSTAEAPEMRESPA